jgi:hypothetical protein
MKNICLLISGFLLLSFNNSYVPVKKHLPEFLIIPSDWVLPKTAQVECEAYSESKFVDTLTDYLDGIDSIAIKYVDYRKKSKPKTTYTSFYCRANGQSWKKYNRDKVLVQFVSERRNDTVINDIYYGRIYYSVR